MGDIYSVDGFVMYVVAAEVDTDDTIVGAVLLTLHDANGDVVYRVAISHSDAKAIGAALIRKAKEAASDYSVI